MENMGQDIYELPSVTDFCKFFGVETLHPLVSMASFENYGVYPSGAIRTDMYCVMYKELHCGELKYGRSRYDYQDGTLLFMSPGQIIGLNGRTEDAPKAKGFVLVFHPDLLYGTTLARVIKDYSFFSYDVNEALHMSDREKGIILNCFHLIADELDNNIDRHTKQIVASYIETMLNHCSRFYERQFVTRELSNKSIISRLDDVLKEYFESGRQEREGIPSVQFCASEVCLSPNYFGDLIKRETGTNASDFIQKFIIDRAKILLSEGDRSISEIAYQLGYKYPHHLTRIFKKVTGITPNEYKISCN